MVLLVVLGRVAVSVLLVVAGVFQWWTLAVLLLAGGYASNIMDDRLTYRWHINTNANHRLRANANAVLTFCVLCAVTCGGLWHAAVLLLIPTWVVIRWLEPRLHGDWLAAARLVPPMTTVCLLVGAEATTMRAAWGTPYAASITLLALLACCLCYTERDRVLTYINDAVREED